jgi:hypothetical protein
MKLFCTICMLVVSLHKSSALQPGDANSFGRGIVQFLFDIVDMYPKAQATPKLRGIVNVLEEVVIGQGDQPQLKQPMRASVATDEMDMSDR